MGHEQFNDGPGMLLVSFLFIGVLVIGAVVSIVVVTLVTSARRKAQPPPGTWWEPPPWQPPRQPGLPEDDD